jgi:hypothetical protein
MAEKFTVEAHHSFVFVPFHKNRPCFAASPLMMNHMGIGYKYDFPAPLAKTHAPIQVFTVHKITIIQRANIQQRVAPYQHAGAGHGFNFHGTIG